MSVLITGANRGIGLGLMCEYLKLDSYVLATVRKSSNTEKLKRVFRQFDRDTQALVHMDVTNKDSVQRAFHKISNEIDHIDVLINNAGVHPEEGNEPFADLKLDFFKEAFEVNVYGVALVTQVFLPLLIQSQHPRIVNISSGAGSIAAKCDSSRYCYSASKAALNMMTRSLANELKPQKIIVVAMSPGWVKTDMGGPNAQLTVQESAHNLVNAIQRIDLKSTGMFLDRFGKATTYSW